jgi:hypothetical protein
VFDAIAGSAAAAMAGAVQADRAGTEHEAGPRQCRRTRFGGSA